MVLSAQVPTKAVATLLKRLEEERGRRDLTQKAFSSLIGMDQSNYADYKNGREKWDPYLSTVQRIAERLNLSLPYLLSEDEPELPPGRQRALDLGEEVLRLVAGTVDSPRKR